MRRRLLLLAPLGLPACVSVQLGGEAPAQSYHLLTDAAPALPRRAQPIVAALLIQPLPSDAAADTTSIAFARRANEFSYYQFSSWTERPVRRVPRLLLRRLEDRAVAGAVGMVGDPLRADWLLTLTIDALHHDAAEPPGQARLALTAELFDRRNRTRAARRQFEQRRPVERSDAAAAAAALSKALGGVFDALVPWLEEALQAAAAPAR